MFDNIIWIKSEWNHNWFGDFQFFCLFSFLLLLEKECFGLIYQQGQGRITILKKIISNDKIKRGNWCFQCVQFFALLYKKHIWFITISLFSIMTTHQRFQIEGLHSSFTFRKWKIIFVCNSQNHILWYTTLCLLLNALPFSHFIYIFYFINTVETE